VLGANDGLVSVSSIMLGVGAGSSDRHTLLLSGLSALVAGALQHIEAQRLNIGGGLGGLSWPMPIIKPWTALAAKRPVSEQRSCFPASDPVL